MRLRNMFKGREGVTLIELLVVILIIVILAVAMLPVLTPFVTRAKYAADGIPAIGNLRTQIQLYFTEKEYLPGLNKNVDGVVVPVSGATTAYGGMYGNSDIDTSTGFGQTLDRTGNYYQQTASGVQPANQTWSNQWTRITATAAINNHFATDLDISPSDLLGNNVSPDCFVYSCISGSYKANTYLYVVGVFGEGTRLKSGTGYAVLQVNNPANTANPSFIATWKRWKPKYKNTECSCAQVKLIMVPSATINAWPGTTPANLANNCAFPQELLSTTAADFPTAMTALRTAGWEF